jgi:hypothetical protein
LVLEQRGLLRLVLLEATLCSVQLLHQVVVQVVLMRLVVLVVRVVVLGTDREVELV